MTKKNIAAMNEMDKVSGGMIWQPGMPTKPVPGGLYMAEERPNPMETSTNAKNSVKSIDDLYPPGGRIIDTPPMIPPMIPNNVPWPHCGN